MRAASIILCVALVSLVSAASGDATDTRLRIDVSPRISTAPAVVRIRAIVTPDAANRALQIVADSATFYRSSLVPLDGANAAAVTETTLKNLPGGEYEVTVTLVEADGRHIMDRRTIMVTSLLAE